MIFISMGVGAMLLLSRMDYRLLGPLSVTLYLLALAALVFVLVAGDTEYGSRRWISLPGTQVQPSEIAKMCTVIMLAKYLSDHEEQIETPRVFLTSLGIAFLPAVLVLVEPDLGSAMSFGALWLGIAIVGGVRPLHLMGLAGVVAALTPVAIFELTHGYQRERINSWRDPEGDPLGSGFQTLQAEISIGSGGLTGKGFTEGTQTQLDFLRTQTTDYVFSVLGEELGFVGALVLFSLFMLLLFRGLRAAAISQDVFGRMLAVGIVIFILFQAFINIGVNIRLFPVTGIPLPFISQGGSSLVTVFIAVGLLESVIMRHQQVSL
jgi:rod shape determining protein RodA